MVRKLVVTFTSVVLFAAAHAKALGLGEVVLDSALNQPLDAKIALLQLGDVRPDQISVQIADENDFARFSIERETQVSAIEVNVQSLGANTFVQLSTVEAVREPYLSFVLETRWPSGRLLSEHTLLLDLPAFASTGGAAPVQQPVLLAQQNIQGQSSNAQSTEPTPAQPARLAAPSTESLTANNDESITIEARDTLWDVALQVRPDSSVSVQQTMLALQSLNREAFIADNINMVRQGQVLRIPTLEQIRNLNAREAMSEVARQNLLFDNRRNAPLTAQPITSQPQSNPTATPSRGELSVVSVDNAEPSAAVSGSGSRDAEFDARIASLEDALAVVREEADRSERVNAELTTRLGLLEEQIDSAQEIIRLRDLELAQLQQMLEEATAAEPVAAEPEPVDPPTVITMAPEKTMIEQFLATLVANTYALAALIGLLILMLVAVLLRRNRTRDQADMTEIEGMEVDAGAAAAKSEPSAEGNALVSAEDKALVDEGIESRGVASEEAVPMPPAEALVTTDEAKPEIPEDGLEEEDTRIVDEGEENYFNELNALDDVDLAEDSEANAEADEGRVLASSPEESDAGVEIAAPEEDSSHDVAFEFVPDEVETELVIEPTPVSRGADENIELRFASSEPVYHIEELDETKEDNAADLGEKDASVVAGSWDDLQFVDDLIEQANDAIDEDDEESDENFEFLSDADEAATKLDLAHAYIEMGDHDGARDILEEVQKEGNEGQAKDASELLKKL